MRNSALSYASLTMRVFCAHSRLLQVTLAAAFWATTAAIPTVSRALETETDALGPDKALHYTVSVGLTLAASLACDVIGLDESITLPLSIGFAFGMGVGKETFDALRGGGFSTADLSWDVLGIATGVLLRVLIRALFEPQVERPVQERERAATLHFFLRK